jgi:hypothetical protein
MVWTLSVVSLPHGFHQLGQNKLLPKDGWGL